MKRRRQRGADWYVIDGKLIRLDRKPGLIDWTAENRFRAAAAVGLVVLMIMVGIHMAFSAWDKQIAIDDEINRQQLGDFYAAQAGE